MKEMMSHRNLFDGFSVYVLYVKKLSPLGWLN